MAATLTYPVGDITVSCTWGCHTDRNPPSTEPGTDYACSYGTKIYAPATGTVVGIHNANSYGGGRTVFIQASDGTTWCRELHMSVIHASVGQKVTRGATVVGLSGASGFGEDWYYGPHLHQTLWVERSSQPVAGITGTVDFEKYLTTGGGDVAISDADAKKVAQAIWGYSGGYGSYSMRDLVRKLWADLTPGEAGVKHDGTVYSKVKDIPSGVWGGFTFGEYTADGVTHPEESAARRLRRAAIAADAARQRAGGEVGTASLTDLIAAGLTPEQISQLAKSISEQIEVPDVVDPEEVADAVVDEMADRLGSAALRAGGQNDG